MGNADLKDIIRELLEKICIYQHYKGDQVGVDLAGFIHQKFRNNQFEDAIQFHKNFSAALAEMNYLVRSEANEIFLNFNFWLYLLVGDWNEITRTLVDQNNENYILYLVLVQ